MKKRQFFNKFFAVLFFILSSSQFIYASENTKTNLEASKTIAVLTSGGDAPGMNSAINAIVTAAYAKGIKVKGVYGGYNGLLNDKIFDLEPKDVEEIINKGGTILHTSRSKNFKTTEGFEKSVETCKKHQLDCLIIIGGNGTFKGTEKLCASGIKCVFIPGTIDNDFSASDYTIGADTAVNTAISMSDRLADSCTSHNLVSVVEVMGRHCGYIALNTGIGVNAVETITPEEDYDLEKTAEKIKLESQQGLNKFTIVVAEGVNKTKEIAKEIEKKTGIQTRTCILGHTQRGGSPSAIDRVIAHKMGTHAVELFANNKFNKAIVVRNGQLVDIDITEAANAKRELKERCKLLT